MKTAIELIAKEREEQLVKHGYTLKHDKEYNSTFERPLTKAASALTIDDTGNRLAKEAMRPATWHKNHWDKIMDKPYLERLVIAGALIAAEIDLIRNLEVKIDGQ